MTERHPLFQEVTDLDLPKEWLHAGERIRSDSRTVLVLGAPDSGKSTFALWAAEQCSKSGQTVAFIDGDMGQTHVGPPTTIGLEIVRPGGVARESYLYFVGATSPKQHLLQTLAGVRMLLDKAGKAGAEKVIIDTTGLVFGGAARELKLQKINLVQPDHIAAIQRTTEVEHLLGPHTGHPGMVPLRLPVSSRAKSRKRDTRRNYRTERFRAYFANAARVDFPLSQVWLQGRSFCSGRPLGNKECAELSKILGAKLVFGNRLQEELFVITNASHNEEVLEKARKYFGVSFIFHMPIGAFRNLVVGLVDASGLTVAVGLFFYMNLQEKIASVYTPHPNTQGVEMIQFGSLHVSPTGKELEWH